MSRFFTEEIAGDIARITGEDVSHIARVLRLRAGDEVEISDGRGTEYTGTITGLAPDAVTCALRDRRACPAEPRHRATLFQALPKQGKMETIVQKCVELGVSEIVPVVTARCVAVPTGDFEKKRVRYQRVALEAAKQSRRGVIPPVRGAVQLGEADLSGFSAVLVAYEDERKTTLKEALRALPPDAGDALALVIGPEGGFEKTEVAALLARGAIPVSLGPRILRTETAGMAMLAEVLYELE